MAKPRCVDNAAQAEVMNEVFQSVGRGRELTVSLQAQRHLDNCNACSNELALWIKQAEASYEMSLVNDLIDRAMKSDSNVKRKAVPAGLALFRKTAEHTGIFALVDLSYRLIAKDWMTEQEFEDWEEAVS